MIKFFIANGGATDEVYAENPPRSNNEQKNSAIKDGLAEWKKNQITLIKSLFTDGKENDLRNTLFYDTFKILGNVKSCAYQDVDDYLGEKEAFKTIMQDKRPGGMRQKFLQNFKTMYDTYYNSVTGVFDNNGITSLPVQKFALEQTKIPVIVAFWNLCNTPKFMELVNAHDLKQASRQEESKAQHLNLNGSQ